MKFLHTSDWHLGKRLDNSSRHIEQRLFLEELLDIVINENIDIIIIAGDIYDSFNPPFEAEKLFFEYMEKLSKEALIVIIAGNHDSTDKLSAPIPLLKKSNIIVSTMPNTKVEMGKYNSYEILESHEGFFKLLYKNVIVNFITLPYANEKRMEKAFFHTDEKKTQEDFSDRTIELINERTKYFDDGINIFTAHIFVGGGESSFSERDISLGGSLLIGTNIFPDHADYIALGHLHNNQKIKSGYYSGSPIQYSLSERNRSKYVNIINIPFNDKENKTIEKHPLTIHKPIELWEVDTIHEAIKIAKEKQSENSFVYVKINSPEIISALDIKTLRETKEDIIKIEISSDLSEEMTFEETRERPIEEEFSDYYKKYTGKEPDDKITRTFLSLIEEVTNER